MSRQGQLLRPQRNGEDDFSIAQIVLNAFITIPVCYLQCRKLMCQALAKPLRHLPQLKAVMHDDQQLHGGEILTNDGLSRAKERPRAFWRNVLKQEPGCRCRSLDPVK